jgi:hypothetical protein
MAIIKIEKEIARRIYSYENPERIALSKKYPSFKKPIIFFRHQVRGIQNYFNFKIKYERKSNFFSCIVARHQSVLRRRLGDSSQNYKSKKL